MTGRMATLDYQITTLLFGSGRVYINTVSVPCPPSCSVYHTGGLPPSPTEQ